MANAPQGVPYIAPSPNQMASAYDPAAIMNMLLEPDYYARVGSLSGGYSNMFVMPLVIERMRRKYMGPESMPRMVQGRGGANTRYVMGEKQVQQPVSHVTQNGSNLNIYWQDPTYQWFRKYDDVINNTSANVHGTVISPDLNVGFITIAPADNSTPLNISDWNSSGMTVVCIGSAFPYRNTGREQIIEVPIPVTNYTQISRDTVKIYESDKYLTYPKTEGGQPWVFAQQDLTKMWMDKQKAITALYGVKGIGGTQDNPIFRYQGLDASIADPVIGGVYDLMPTMPQADDFLDYWKTLSNKRFVEKNTLYHIVGRDYLSMLQNTFTNGVILPVGINNTLERVPGAEIIEGLDAYSYAFDGIRHVWIRDPGLDDLAVSGSNNSQLAGMQNMSLSSASCYTIDLGMISTAQGNQYFPAMEQVFFGQMPYRIGVKRGMSDNPFVGLRPELQGSMYEIATSENSNTIELMYNMGYNFTCPNMGCHKPSK